MVAPSKFDAPKPGKNVEAGAFQKLAERVEVILEKTALYPAPKQLDPDLLMVSPNNRLGAPPNTHHIHFGVLKSIKEKAYDRTRPAVGICVEYKSEAGKKKVLEHNRKFTQGNKLLPGVPVDLANAKYHHCNLAGWQGIAKHYRNEGDRGPQASQCILSVPYAPRSVSLLADM